MAIMYLSNASFHVSHRTDNAHRTQLSPYVADIMHKPDINSIENSLDPDQLAEQDPHCFPYNMAL